MYKVLFADDEYWIREKIKSMIEWNKYSLELLEPAVDGEEVLAKIERYDPHILITDINMPFINGVDLVKTVRKKYPDIIIFIISGYSDFNYVKDTLVAGAINYLLKPVKKIDLISTLSSALEILGNREQLELKQKEEMLKSLKASSLIQDRELSYIVDKEDSIISTVLSSEHNDSFSQYRMAVIQIHDIDELIKNNNNDMNMLSYNTKKKIKSIFGRENIILFNYLSHPDQFIIITDLNHKKLVELSRRVIEYFKSAVKSPISIAVTGPSYTVDNINDAYRNCISKIMKRKYDKSSQLLVEINDGDSNKKNVNHVTEEDKKKIKKLLYINNVTLLKKAILDDIGLKNCSDNQWNYEEVKQTVKIICDIILDFIYEELSSDVMNKVQKTITSLKNAIDSLDERLLSSLLEAIIEDVAAARENNKVSSDSITGAVQKAIKYIDENYTEELSLKELADRYNVEYSYFSKVFRQKKGVNLMMYISKKRINKSKEFMKNNNLTLTDIAFMVGYDDYAYFNRVFRKIEGVSPREYRSEVIGMKMISKKC